MNFANSSSIRSKNSRSRDALRASTRNVSICGWQTPPADKPSSLTLATTPLRLSASVGAVVWLSAVVSDPSEVWWSKFCWKERNRLWDWHQNEGWDWGKKENANLHTQTYHGGTHTQQQQNERSGNQRVRKAISDWTTCVSIVVL